MNNLFTEISEDKNKNKVAEILVSLGKNPNLEDLKDIFLGQAPYNTLICPFLVKLYCNEDLFAEKVIILYLINLYCFEHT